MHRLTNPFSSKVLLVLACLSAGAACYAATEREQWSSTIKLARLATLSGNNSAAQHLFERALGQAEGFPRCDSRIPETLDGLAAVFAARREFKRCEEIYKESLARRVECLERSDGLIAVSLQHLGDVSCQRMNFSLAEKCYRSEIEILKQRFGPGDRVMSLPLVKLANSLWRMGRDSEAEQLYRQSIDLRQRFLGSDNPALCQDLSMLSHLCLSQRKYADSEALASKVLKICKQAYGNSSERLIQPLLLLGTVSILRKDYDLGQSSALEALTILQKSGSDEGSLSARQAKQILLRSYDGKCRFDLAEPLYEELLVLGNEDAAARGRMYDFVIERATGLRDQTSWAELDLCCNRALKAFPALKMDQAIELWELIGFGRIMSKQWNLADKTLQHCISLKRQAGVKLIGSDLTSLAFVYMNKKQFAQSEKYLKLARIELDSLTGEGLETNWLDTYVCLLKCAGRADEVESLKESFRNRRAEKSVHLPSH
jgi:hypothetical protein